jgi:ankyrin repeat protein
MDDVGSLLGRHVHPRSFTPTVAMPVVANPSVPLLLCVCACSQAMGGTPSTLGNALLRECELGHAQQVDALLAEGADVNFHNQVCRCCQ